MNCNGTFKTAINYYTRRLCRSAWVECSVQRCLFVCLDYNSKTNDLKMLKLGIGISYKYYGFRVERSKVRVQQ